MANDYIKLWVKDYRALLEPFNEAERGRILVVAMVQDKIISRYTEHEDEIKRFWFDIARGEVHLLDP